VISAHGMATVAAARVSVTAVTAVFGLVIGSFLNVVVYRVPRGLSVVRPGSFCPVCSTPIRSSDNVPVVSWLALRGRCRVCGAPISARYPIVEVATGVTFAAVAWVLGAHWGVPGMCALGATALALAVIELDGLPSPAAVSLIGTGLGTVLLSAAAIADGRWWHLGGMLIGTAVASAVVAGSWRAQRGHAGRTVPWALLPGGAVMGWAGAVGASVGVVTSALVVAGLSVLYRRRPHMAGASSGHGIAVAVALGGAAALIGALVGGSPVGP
jgi:leader peptidase (prepilin peptidase) / N-methyltransferase